jgi:pimeloyl-ACP methyl ester carboxylesterase
MKKIYCISGLGADHRVFERLEIPDYVLVPVKWLKPEQGETLVGYAGRLQEQIVDDSPILMGLSFGGIVALELSKLVKPALTILVSSVKDQNEIPPYLRAIGKTGLDKAVPFRNNRVIRKIARGFQGITSNEDRELFDAIMNVTEMGFAKWAVGQFLRWQGCRPVGKVVHLHGSADRIIPARYVKPDILVEGGSHFMIVIRAIEIQDELARILNES